MQPYDEWGFKKTSTCFEVEVMSCGLGCAVGNVLNTITALRTHHSYTHFTINWGKYRHQVCVCVGPGSVTALASEMYQPYQTSANQLGANQLATLGVTMATR